ncbi:MAG: helix-turn-helix domain-containing protein [Patescibacteria group bacterium]
MTHEQLLQKVGFSQNEAKVYLAALEMGVAAPQGIAMKAGLQRTTTYSVLKSLVDQGVVGKVKVGKKTRIKAEPPQKLLGMVEELRGEIQKRLPELEATFNASEVKPKITFYEGKQAIQNVYDDTLREKPEEILEWNTDAYFDAKNVDPTYIAKRMKLNIKAKRIAGSGSRWDIKHKNYDQSELSETLIVPRDVFWPGVEVNIYKNKVAFLSYTDHLSVIIESKAIADCMRQAYHLSWIGARELVKGAKEGSLNK